MYTAGRLLIDNCTLSLGVANNGSGGLVLAAGWRAAVLLNRVALQSNTGQRSLVTSEGGTMFSTQPGLQYFDDDTSEALALTPAGIERKDLFLDFDDRWLAVTLAVRRIRSQWPI